MCDKKMPIKLKYKIYKTIVKPAMIYGSECWAVDKNDTQKLQTTEIKKNAEMGQRQDQKGPHQE